MCPIAELVPPNFHVPYPVFLCGTVGVVPVSAHHVTQVKPIHFSGAVRLCRAPEILQHYMQDSILKSWVTPSS